jgi:lipopolysaccharide export system permease protein
MNLLDRYLGRSVVVATLLALCVLVAVDSFIDFIDELNDVGQHGYTIGRAIYVTLLSLPQGCYDFFPTAALLGGLLGLGGLAAGNELVVFRASGVSVIRIVAAVLKTGMLMVMVVILIGEMIAPVGQQRAQDLKKRSQEGAFSLREKDGLWARNGSRFINVKEVYPGLRLGDVRVYTVDEEQRLVEAVFAGSAIFRGGKWLLRQVSRSTISHAGVATEHAARQVWTRLVAPQLLRVIVVKPEDMSAWRLAQYIHYLQVNHLAAERYELAFWTRFASPLSTLVMLLLALPFVFGPPRSGSTGQRLLIGALIGLSFHLFNRAFNHLALVYGLEPLLGAILPVVLFAVVGMVAVARIR